MDRNSKLLKNSAIYMVGNFASKVLSFILIPLYTIYLKADDYGNIDLLITSSSLILPLITLQVVGAAYRFMLDAKTEEDKNKIISNSIFVYFIGYTLFVLVFIPIQLLCNIKYGFIFMIYVVVVYFFQLLQQLCRGLRLNAVYASMGVLITLVQGMANILFIMLLHMGGISLLVAPVIASVICIIIIHYKSHIFYKFKIRNIEIHMITKLLKYSAPLCIESLCWWVMTSVGTYFLVYITQNTSNSGIYAMANKFPQLLAMVNSIFFLAWQESAVEEYSSNDSNLYFTKMYNNFLSVQLTVIFIMLPAIHIYFDIFKISSFAESVKYIPFLLVINIFGAAIMYISNIYNVVKKTRNRITSSIGGMLISLMLYFLLIPYMKIYGLIIALAAGHLFILLYRVVDTRKYIQLKIYWKKQSIGFIVLLLSIMNYFLNGLEWQWFGLIIGSFSFLFINSDLINKVVEIFRNSVGGKK